MCNNCNDPHHLQHAKGNDRRKFIASSATLAAAAMVANPVRSFAQGIVPFNAAELDAVTAYGMKGPSSPFEKITIKRRKPLEDDVVIDIYYASICHSDIHTARGDWGPANYPIVPGHEMVGRVVSVGSKVTKFKVGDLAGVGCMVNSCMQCESCLNDREQNCLKGTTFTYDSDDNISGGVTYGGYSQKIVVPQHFAIKIPQGVDLAATAPLLCAGITTFSPMQHWDVQENQTVGVIGMGGLGHMAVKLAVARGAQVVVFTTTPEKIADAKNFGAMDAVLWNDENGMEKYTGKMDWMISTVPETYDVSPFINLLKLDKTLVNVGVLGALDGINGGALIFGRKNIAGSLIGGIAETQEVVDYCAARNIKSEIEMITPDQITNAYDRVVNKDVRYRFVIDMKKAA